MTDFHSFAEFLMPVVRQAGAAIMEFHGGAIDVMHKDDGSPVTLADEAAEALILPALAQLTPDIPVVSEENAASHSLKPASRFWLVDPLDGTREFLKTDGQGAFTVNIALIEEGVPVFGIVFAPALDRLCFGSIDGGAFEDTAGARKSLTGPASVATGLTAVASISHRDSETEKWLETHAISHLTSIGSSLKYCLLAAGEADVYPRFSPTMEWDTAAGDAILRAAGGTMVQPDGSAFVYGKLDYRNGPFVAWASRALRAAHQPDA